MSQMRALYEKVAADSTLLAKFKEIMENAQQAGEEETNNKLISFAKDAGYIITSDEMKEYFKEMSKSENSSLSDAELDMVAGGKSTGGSFMVALSVLTFGITCAWASIEIENKDKGGCGEFFK